MKIHCRVTTHGFIHQEEILALDQSFLTISTMWVWTGEFLVWRWVEGSGGTLSGELKDV